MASAEKMYGTYAPVGAGVPGPDAIHRDLSRDPNRPNRPNRPWYIRALLPLAVLCTLLASISLVTVQTLYYAPESDLRKVPSIVTFKPMDSGYRPTHKDGSRLVLVGDVHGMIEPLEDLLAKINFDTDNDHLVLLGDFVTKGKHSQQVLDLAMKMGASCVRGNHEDEVLRWYDEARAATVAWSDVFDVFSYGFSYAFDKSRDRKFARKLRPKQVEFLTSCPAILDLGHVGNKGRNAVAVHGGVMWNVDDMNQQDPGTCMTIRSLVPPSYEIATAEHGGLPWADKWNDFQKSLPKANRTVVFYGHNSAAGLDIRKYSRGLDTGCVSKGRLTATVITQKRNGKFKNELVSVNCKHKS